MEQIISKGKLIIRHRIANVDYVDADKMEKSC